MSTDKPSNTDSGDIYSTIGRRESLLDFQHEVIEVEDLIKECLAEHRLRCSSGEVRLLIQEWKALYQRKIGEDISDEDFSNTEIGKFIAQHELYEAIEKMI